MFPELSGKGLFVFSDPGGAKPILSLLELNKGRFVSVKIVSDRSYHFFKDFTAEVDHPSLNIGDDFHFNPDFVFTGTSYTSCIELNYIAKAKELSIPTFSFVDHWTSIRDRFKYNDTEILPNYILVLDERAKQLAIKQGLDIIKIIVTENPYHEWLKNWRPSIEKNIFLDELDLMFRGKKVLLYAPDPLSNVNGNKEYGFDEVSATAKLVELFNSNNEALRHWKVLVKPHPNQQIDLLKNIILGHTSFYLLPNDTDTNTAIYHSDIVLGFFSSILIEAALMNKTVLRFLDFKVQYDPIAELNIGRIINRDNFISALEKVKDGIE